jgi:hypothetical protein
MNKLVILKFAAALAGSVFAVSTVSSQVIISVGDTYTQNFDLADPSADLTTVNNTGTNVPAAWSWTNNSTYAGWFRQVKSSTNTNAADKDFIGEFRSNTVRFGSMGNGGTFDSASEPRTDRALGSLIEGVGTEVSFGVVFQVAGASLSGLNVTYTGEQWFRAPSANTLEFQYKVLGSFDPSTFLINDETGWTDFNSLDFTAPKTGTNQKINGNFAGDENFAANKQLLSGTISLSALDGQYIAIRWKAVDKLGTTAAQSGLGVDNLSITAVPEPATYALLAGVLTLGFALYRRRRA